MLPTFQDLYDAAKAEIQSRNSALTDWNEGSVLDAVAGAAAALADESIRRAVDLFAALFVDTATGAELDALAADRFNLARKVATGSRGVVTWSRVAAGSYVLAAGTRFRATVGDEVVTVESIADVAVLSSSVTVEVPCEATATGRATNCAAGSVSEVVNPPIEDPTGTVTNAQAFAGGSDAETDAAFRDRIRRYFGTLRRGTVEALEAGALMVPGVSYVSVDEGEVEDSGVVYVYVGDPDARANDTLANMVDLELNNWRAAGVMVVVQGAQREEVAITIALAIEPGADQDTVAAAVRAAVEGYADLLPPDAPARLSRIEKAAHEASELVVAARVSSHTADLEPSSGRNAIRIPADQIGLVITEVA